MKRIWLVVAMAAMIGCHTVRDRARVPGPVAKRDLVEEAKTVAVTPARTAEETRTVVTEATVLTPPAIKPILTPVNNAQLRDAYFDYDRADPDAEALAALRFDAQLLIGILRDFPKLKVTIEGHCDDRGSAEYNMGLGERRASRALDAMRELGFPADAAGIISYGKEAPQCEEATEACRHLNRRAHLVVRE